MLNVPDTVKALFKRDGVRKNFRVHFPNGELPDITNDNIVQESVKFTESLCSQDVLKFGLTEASVIEFETVGIGNMYGMTAECGIEIDLSSLTAAQLNDIASGTWDGVYTDAASSDIGYAYFRVPYGVFRIESCPRDHKAMAHRKVQAYGFLNELLKNSPFEKWKEQWYTQNESYNADVNKVITANMAYFSPELVAGYNRTAVTNTFSSKDTYTVTFDLTYGSQTSVAVHTYKLEVIRRLYSVAPADTDNLYEILLNSYDTSPINTGLTSLQSKYRTKTFDGHSTTAPLSSILKQDLVPFMNGGGNQVEYFYDDVPCLYPYRGGSYQFGVYILTEVKLTFQSSTTAITGSNYDFFADNIESFQFNRLSGGEDFGEITIKSTGQVAEYYTYNGSYSLIDLLNAYLELNAQFGRVNRLGEFVAARLDNTSPLSVTGSEYSEFWWDEYDVLPVGSVEYSYTDSENNQNVVVYQFGQGLSQYDMTDNFILRNYETASESAINTMLSMYFIPYLSPVNFTPIELSMKGLPYMEAGDYLAVTAEDGTIANSFNMKMEINGIQVLTASIESTSGDIIESGESE